MNFFKRGRPLDRMDDNGRMITDVRSESRDSESLDVLIVKMRMSSVCGFLESSEDNSMTSASLPGLMSRVVL